MDTVRYEALTLTLCEDDDTPSYTVTACDKAVKEVEIPLMVNGLPVTEIGDYAFQDCKELCTVTFPELTIEAVAEGAGIRRIGDHAFMGCVFLKRMDIPATVSSVGWGCFHSCQRLKEVVAPSHTYFSGYAFAHCSALWSVTPLSTVSEGLFSHCVSLTTLPLTEDAEEIGEDGFENCAGLKRITIPASVTEIEALAFRGCENLTHVTFAAPDGWYEVSSHYDKEGRLTLDDPQKNAKWLSEMDFDDGVIAWRRRKP